jgi:hypothetical protein
MNELPVRGGKGIARAQLASRFRALSEDDLSTTGVFVVARK